MSTVYDVFEIPYDDKSTFKMICEGGTTLVFQLESNLLRKWSKKFAPETVMEVAALTAVVRPGVLNTVDENNVSAADHIVERKHGREPAVPIHPILSNSLKNTWQALLYQESLLPLCKDVANWDSDKALDLLKAVAKKKMDLIVKYKGDFVADAVAYGKVNEQEATKIYESLEASGRYLFSMNHSAPYGKLAYVTAYHKCHNKLKYYCAALIHSVDESKPLEEVARIAESATEDKIKILPPHIKRSKEDFSIEGDAIRFGLINIGGIGASQVKALKKSVGEIEKVAGKPIDELTWYEFLILTCHKSKKTAKISPSVATTLAECGALSCFGVDRKRMCYEIKSFNDLSDGEYKWVLEHYKEYDNLADLVQAAAKPVSEGGAGKKNRIESIESVYKLLIDPPYSLTDTIDGIVAKERKLLGTNLTASRLDKFDTRWVNAYVADFNNGESIPNPSYFAVVIEEVVKTVTKKGKNPGQEMARLRVSDQSGKTKSPCFLVFPKVYQQVADLCEEGNVVVINGEVSKDGDALYVNEMSLL